MENRIETFNLRNDGDVAIVRMLHKTTNTIEEAMTHWVDVQGKMRMIRCCGENCPICSSGNKPTKRIFIHLLEYSDGGREKVWSRTDKILPQLTDISNNWGGLHNCVLQIKRVGDSFPKYEINVVNPMQYPPIPNIEMLDKKIGYMFYMTRSADEMTQFYATGVLPPHKRAEFIPKEQYAQQKQSAPQTMPYSNQQGNVITTIPPKNESVNAFPQNYATAHPTHDAFTVDYPPVSGTVTKPYTGGYVNPTVTPYEQWANVPKNSAVNESVTPYQNAVPTNNYVAPPVNLPFTEAPAQPVFSSVNDDWKSITDDFDDPFAPISNRI